MKRFNKIKSTISIVLTLSVFALFVVSCEENAFFEYDTLPSYHDGIMNLDEEGVDCGGGSGVPCPSCTDGIQNQGEEGVDCGGPCADCPDATPRADGIRAGGTDAPYWYTFESGQEQSGEGLEPMHTNPDGSAYSQGVTPNYGQADPDGSTDLVTRIVRPANGPFGGFEDFKFQTFENPIDFSTYHKYILDVYIPSADNDFSGNLAPQVEVILHDNVDGNFWQRWTIISATVDPGDFDGWVRLYFDGTNALSADNQTPLPQNTTYTNVTLRFGSSNHQEEGTFYVKDLFPVLTYTQPGTPRADDLAEDGTTAVYFTFESDGSGNILEPMHTNPDGSTYSQGVDILYGVADPAGSANGVAQVTRPNDGRFGGFEDFKFQYFDESFDFTTTNRFQIDVYIPSTNDFSGNLAPTVDLILHINSGNFWETWTVLTVAIDPADFDSWQTIEFDGSGPLPGQTIYNSFTLRFGGAGHTESGVFYVKDFVSLN